MIVFGGKAYSSDSESMVCRRISFKSMYESSMSAVLLDWEK